MKPEWQAPISVVGVTGICLTYVFVVPGVSALDLCTGAGLGASAMWALTEWEARQARRRSGGHTQPAVQPGKDAASVSSRLSALRARTSSLVGAVVQMAAARPKQPAAPAGQPPIRRARPAGPPAAGGSVRQDPRRRPLVATPEGAARVDQAAAPSPASSGSPPSAATAERAYRPAADVLPRLDAAALDPSLATAPATRAPFMADEAEETFSFAPRGRVPAQPARPASPEAPAASLRDWKADGDPAIGLALPEPEPDDAPAPALHQSRAAPVPSAVIPAAMSVAASAAAGSPELSRAPVAGRQHEASRPPVDAGHGEQRTERRAAGEPAGGAALLHPSPAPAQPAPLPPVPAHRPSVRLLEETVWTVAPANDAGPVAVHNEQLVRKIAEDLILALAEREGARKEDDGAPTVSQTSDAQEQPLSAEDLPFKLEIPDIVRQALARHTEGGRERDSLLAAQRDLAPMPLELGRRERIRQELERRQAERRQERELMEADRAAPYRHDESPITAGRSTDARSAPARRPADRGPASGTSRA